MKVLCRNCKGQPFEAKCSERCNPENCACGGEDFRCPDCEGGYETIEDTPLDKVLRIKKEIREATEKILSDYDLNWRTYGELEHEALMEFAQLGVDGVELDGIRAVLVSKPIHQFKKSECKVIGHNQRIELHRR
jgi:hypothetical protein